MTGTETSELGHTEMKYLNFIHCKILMEQTTSWWKKMKLKKVSFELNEKKE